ncbi:uncharacterized protein A1O5_06212 [Cladophialophora psammophila CBS 110553]|uniref:Cytochrome P450 oxidoreductase n=1 Tax=Cladophialophora psammophila CBS 110553 TaxID=1182543 RepID=W9XIF7_9EURO|nr:uncharacterized protein A1O5_06212 [Cladophialophora psammophila CBS 110553]EXJ70144.1 hypothetical protein A1O5_06212 [Cladophialophora psammophila CBS 110553]
MAILQSLKGPQLSREYVVTLFILPAIVGLIYFLQWFIQRYFRIGMYRNLRYLPPGPPSGVFTGTPGYPKDKCHLFFKKLSDEYGEIFSVWQGPNLQIVLNSPRVVRDLCYKRGNIYNDRPKMYAFHDCIFRGISIVSTGYNNLWKKQRKIFNSVSGPAAVKNFLPFQDYETKQYLHDLVKSPEQFYMHTERFGASILTAAVYGFRADDITDPSALGLLLTGSWLEENLHPGKYIDDRWPILQKLPRSLARWRKVYDENAKLLDSIARAWWDPAKLAVDQDKAVPCFATGFIKSYASEGFNEDEAALVTLGLMLAGAGTTSSIQNNLIMALALHPHVVEKAHAELDRVVGKNRLPNKDDEQNLPYIRAIIKEIMRWRPFSNQGFYHATTKEDWYESYYIPAHTTVIANAYSIHQDANRHKDPEVFEPARYIDYKLSAQEYANMEDANQRDHFAYGVGRRICAGLNIAEPSLFLLASRLLWGFNISQKRDEDGNLIPIDTLGYSGGVFAKPYPFAASISCRSLEHAGVIDKEYEAAHSDARSLAQATRAGDMPGMQNLVKVLMAHPDTHFATNM